LAYSIVSIVVSSSFLRCSQLFEQNARHLQVASNECDHSQLFDRKSWLCWWSDVMATSRH